MLDAVRDAGNRWVFPDQLADGLEPWGGVRAVWAFGSPEAGHGGRHDRHLRRRAWPRWPPTRRTSTGSGWENWDPREFLEGFGRQSGQRMGVAFATPFQIHPIKWEG